MREFVRKWTFFVMSLLLIMGGLHFHDVFASEDLIINNESYKIYRNGELLKDGDTVNDGDNITLTFDWRVPNNRSENTYTMDLNLKNVTLSDKDKTGTLYFEEKEIATYKVEDGKFIITLVDGAADLSNIHGGVILNAKINISNDKSLPDGSKQEIGIGTFVKDVTYHNPGTHSFSKVVEKKDGNNIYKENDMSYINYKINYNSTDIMKNIKITDDIDENTIIDKDSFVVKDNGKEIKPTITTNDKGFEIQLDDQTSKSESHKYEITYRVQLQLDDISDVSKISNKATLSYTDENDTPQNEPKTTSITPSTPTMKKTGYIVLTSDGNLQYKYFDRTKYYPVKYTITIDTKDFSNAISDDTKINITDTPTINVDYLDLETVLLNQHLASMLATGNTNCSQFTAGFAVDEKGVQFSGMTNDEVITALTNTIKLFGYTYENGRLGLGDQNLTFGDFEKDGSKYSLTYLLLLPSDDGETFKFKNNATAEVLNKTITSESTATFSLPPVEYIVKGPLDDASYDNIGNYTAVRTISYDEEKEKISYALGLNFKSMRFEEVNGTTREKSNWRTKLKDVDYFVLEDTLNAAYYDTKNSNYGYQLGGSTDGSTIGFKGFDNVHLELYQIGRAPKDTLNLSKINEAKQAEEKYLDYLNTYGTYFELEESQRTELTKLMTDYLSLQGSSGYIGSISAEDLKNSSIYKLTQSNGQISVKINAKQFKASDFKKYSYDNPTKTEPSISNVSNLFDGMTEYIENNYMIVLVYDALVDINTINLGPGNSTVFYNGAKVKFENTSNPDDAPYLPSIYNTSYKITREDNNDLGNVTLKKNSTAIKFSDKEFNYKSDSTLGWNLSIDLTKAVAGKEVVIEDTLPDTLDYGDEMIAFFSSSGTISSINNKTYEESEFKDYKLTVDGKKLTIRFTITDDMINKKFVRFYFKTNINASAYVNPTNIKNKKVSIMNSATGTYAGTIPLDKTTSSQTVTVDTLIEKEATDQDGNVTGIPVMKNGVVKGYYTIEYNKKMLKTSENNTVDIIDTMSEPMTLDEDSIKVINKETGETITDYSYKVEDHTVTFTVPDETHLTIQYSVTFDKDIVKQVNWTKKENTTNSVSLHGTIDDSVPGDEVDFSKFEVDMSVWTSRENGSVTIVKSNGKKVLPKAKFKLYSIYDNFENTYEEEGKDSVLNRFNEVETDDEGLYNFDELPLDRVYKLVETQAPQDYYVEDDVYFILDGEDHLSDHLPDSIKELVGDNIYEGPGLVTLTVLNKKIESTSIELTVDKVLKNKTLEDKQFTFELLDENDKVISTSSNDTEGHITFDSITYDIEDLEGNKKKTYTYKVREVIPEEAVDNVYKGITYSDEVQTVEVTVENTGKALKATQSSTPVFENVYQAKGSIHISATKVLEGRKLKDKEFTFVLQDNEHNTLQTVQNDKDGHIVFEDIDYTSDDKSAYIYFISEVKGDDTSITYDTNEVKLIIQIDDNGDGTLNIRYNGLKELKDITFTNTYKENKKKKEPVTDEPDDTPEDEPEETPEEETKSEEEESDDVEVTVTDEKEEKEEIKDETVKEKESSVSTNDPTSYMTYIVLLLLSLTTYIYTRRRQS